MNRVQKKCIIASAGFHLLMLVILVIGPAFFSSDSRKELPTLDFVPSKLVDAAMTGGGNPNGRQPQPVQPPPSPPQPQPAPVTSPAPAPVAPPEKVSRPAPPTIARVNTDVVETNKVHKPQINTTLVTRRSTAPANPKPASNNDPRADARRIASEIGNVTANIRKNSSTSTSIDPIGPGGGGASYASYDSWVKTVYEEAWVEPSGMSEEAATAKVSVTIYRDGTVTSAHIIQSSGNAAVDRSVQAALDRVKMIAPFPDGATDTQRTFKINFNLKAKQSLG